MRSLFVTFNFEKKQIISKDSSAFPTQAEKQKKEETYILMSRLSFSNLICYIFFYFVPQSQVNLKTKKKVFRFFLFPFFFVGICFLCIFRLRRMERRILAFGIGISTRHKVFSLCFFLFCVFVHIFA